MSSRTGKRKRIVDKTADLLDVSQINAIYPPVRDPLNYSDIRMDLDSSGFCVISNILTEEEMSIFEDQFWEVKKIMCIN